MSAKSEEEFEPDMDELAEEEFTEEVEEDDDETESQTQSEQKSDNAEKTAKLSKAKGKKPMNQGDTIERYFWVDNIKPGTKTDKVQDLFKKHGDVLATKVIRGGSNGNLLAFLKFKTPEDAKKCEDALDNTEFLGNTIKIIRDRPDTGEDNKNDNRRPRNNRSPNARKFSPRRRYDDRGRGGRGGDDRGYNRSDNYSNGDRRSGQGFSSRTSRDGARNGNGRDGFRDDFVSDRGSRSFGGGDRGFGRDPGFDRRPDGFGRDPVDPFIDRRQREMEIRREREYFDLEKERLEVERLKLKREREELEKLSQVMTSDRYEKRQHMFSEPFDSGRRFVDDFSRRDDIKRERFVSPERDSRAVPRFTSGGGSSSLSGLGSMRGSGSSSGARFSSSISGGADRYDPPPSKSWQTGSSQWDSHEPSSSSKNHLSSSSSSGMGGRSNWQSSTMGGGGGGGSSSDARRYNNGSSSGMGSSSRPEQRISSGGGGGDRGFGSSSFGGSSSGHRRY